MESSINEQEVVNMPLDTVNMNGNSSGSDIDKIRQTNYETRKTIELVVKQMELLTARVNKFESIADALLPINTVDNDVASSHSYRTDSVRSRSPTKSQKRVHVKSSPANVFIPKELPIDEIIYSKTRENINVGSAKFIPLLDGTQCDQSSISMDSRKIENSDILSSYIINRQTSYSATEKYILTNHNPIALMKHIEKLLRRMNKVEHEIQMLMEKENSLSESKSNCSETSSEDSNLEPHFSHFDSFSLHDPIIQDVKLKTLGKKDVTKFQRVFGLTQKKKDLDSYLSVRNFRSFFEDYTEKFRIIHEFLSFHNETILTNRSVIKDYLEKKVDLKEYESFKNTVEITNLEMKKDIKEYILKDPEAAGIVHFVKDVTCVSCAKPVMMKTTRVPFKHPTKGVFVPQPNLRTKLTYELDRVRRQYNRIPGTRDRNLVMCKCIEPSTRNCVGSKTIKQSHGQKILANDTIPTTSFQHQI